MTTKRTERAVLLSNQTPPPTARAQSIIMGSGAAIKYVRGRFELGLIQWRHSSASKRISARNNEEIIVPRLNERGIDRRRREIDAATEGAPPHKRWTVKLQLHGQELECSLLHVIIVIITFIIIMTSECRWDCELDWNVCPDGWLAGCVGSLAICWANLLPIM